MPTWTFPSKSSAATYTVTHAANGVLTCDCRGWTMKRRGQPRECSHIKQVIADHGLVREVRGDYVFAAPGAAPGLTPTHVASIIDVEVRPVAAVAEAAAVGGMTAPAAMLASAMTTPVTGAAFDATYGNGHWVMDEKIDGHRVVVVKRGDRVVGWSRTGANAKSLPPHIVAALKKLPDCIVDGELALFGGNSWNVTETHAQDKLVYFVFDLVSVMGRDVTMLPLSERRKLLAVVMAHAGDSDALLLVAEMPPNWATVEAIWARGGEGVILKRTASKYCAGARSEDWIKVKEEFHFAGTVTGFAAGSSGPYARITLRLDGGVDTRVKTPNTATLRAIENNPASFLGRRLVIEAHQLTPSGKPRHPRFDHWAGGGE